MTEEEMSRLFAEFSESAEALKKESGSLQEVIAGFEAKLREVGLPIEVWLEERPIQSRELSVSASSVAPTMELQLGYARGSG
ncbi:MAG: hypothetical protein ACE5GW_12175, partial [Planctomycetota bacterium]